MFRAFGPNQTVHNQPLVLPQEFVQEKAPRESGCSGQQDLSKVVWRHGIGRSLPCERRMNHALQPFHVSLTLGWQPADKPRHGVLGNMGLDHA